MTDSDSKSPVARRVTPARATLNTERILHAIEQNASVVGLDQISIRTIAQQAGLTTGAIYARYENVDEMLVALWTEKIAEPFGHMLTQTITAMTSDAEQSLPSEIASVLNKPTALMRLAAEFIVVAQRNEVVGEVVQPAITQLLRDAGLNLASPPIKRAGVAIASSMFIGAALRSLVTGTNPNLGVVANGLQHAYASAVPTTQSRNISLPQPIQSATGNPLRDALINATAEVISRSGFNGATISRIARKSSVTSGSLYHFYGDKESLMNDAVYELMRATQNENLNAKHRASIAHQENFGLTDSFQFGLIPERLIWLKFRQECILATRHHKTTKQILKKVLQEIEVQMLQTFSQIDESIVKLVIVGEQTIGYGYSSLMTYTDLFPTCDFDAIMVQIAKQNGL